MRNLFLGLVLVVFYAILMIWVFPSWAGANVEEEIGPQVDPFEAPLALALAKVTVNEANWHSPPDMALIWQATRVHGRTNEERLRWLRAHSNCVLGEEPPGPRQIGNCPWTWHLEDSDAKPWNWPTYASWERTYLRLWQRIRRAARRLVQCNCGPRVCEVDPDTWGGKRDRRQALARGMILLECGDSLNDGYLWSHNARRLTQR